MRGLSGIRAGLLGAAGGGALAIAALASSTPAMAACSPTAAGTAGAASTKPASGTQTCTGGDTGVNYTATGGDLTVNLGSNPVSGLVSLQDDGNPRNLTLNDGSASFAASAITSSDSSGYAVVLFAHGGNVLFTSVTGATILYNGTAAATALNGNTTGSGNVTITAAGTVTNTSASGNGITAGVTDGAALINALGNVTVNGGIGIGSQALGKGTVTINASGNITAGGNGINAQTTTGSVTINAGTAATPITVTTSTATNASIYAQTTSGAINLTTYGNITPGLNANSSSGAITVTTNGNVTGGGGGKVALFTQDVLAGTTGNIVVNANGGSIISTTGGTPATSPSAIAALNAGTGNSTVNLGDGEIVSSPVAGIDAESAGGTVTVTEGKNTQITAASSTISKVGLFAGAGIFGLSGQNPSSAANTVGITTGSGDTVTITGDNTGGVVAANSGSGKGGVAITLGDSNSVTITGGDTVFGVSAVTANVTGAGTAFSGSGNASISLGSNDVITLGAGDGKGGIFGLDAGLYAVSNGGNVNIGWSGSGGSVSVTGFSGIPTYGVYGATTGTGAVNITTGSGVAITSNNGPAVNAQTGTGAITIVNNATLTGNGTAIATTGGAVGVTNTGTVNGLITTTGASTTSIANKGTWILANVTNSISGSNDAISNSGTLIASGTVGLKGQTGFTNTGLIDLHSANTAPGDALSINGAYTGGGKLSVDAALGTTASGSTCGALADCVNIASSSGTTSVIVNSTSAPAQAGFNGSGVLIINGASAAGNFVLDPGSTNYNANTGTVDNGLFTYGLTYGNNQVRLVSSASAVALNIPALIGAIQGTFYSSDPVAGRVTWLRDTASPAGGSDPSTGVWVDSSLTLGSNTNSASLSTAAGATTVSVGYNQQSYSASLGGDIAFTGVADDSDELVLGALAGFVGSDVAFGANPANGHVSGAQVGGYASWRDDGWFLNADVLADLLTLKYSQNGASLLARNPGMNVVGTNADLGKRLMLDDTIFIEPLASLAYANVSAGDTAAATTTVHFGSNASLRGGLGARAGAYIPSGGLIYNLSLSARAWDEFDNRETVSLINGATVSPLTAKSVGAYGEFVADLNVMGSDSGFGGYVNGTLDVNGIFNQFTLSAGLRYHW